MGASVTPEPLTPLIPEYLPIGSRFSQDFGGRPGCKPIIPKDQEEEIPITI
jgi:hypothetical protein